MDAKQDIDILAERYFAWVTERESNYFDLFLKEELTHRFERVVDQVAQRLDERLATSMERSEGPNRAEHSSPAPRLPAAVYRPTIPEPKAALLKRLRAMQVEGLSLQAIANKWNAEGVPTLSAKRRWQKGTIGNLLA